MLNSDFKTSKHLFHPDEWPVITHVNDILPMLDRNPAIRMFTHDDIQVVRYMINSPDVFTTPLDLEARGLIFETSTGKLLSRPLHKFFNLGERMQIEDIIDDNDGGVFQDKLDGSMVAGFVLNDVLRFHTKGGESPQAKQALHEANWRVKDMARMIYLAGYTPIFEWTSPENRIVLKYDKPELTLLAVRHRETGIYDDNMADSYAQAYKVARPEIIATVNTVDEFKTAIKILDKEKNKEGVVYVKPNGMRVKSKTSFYMQTHKARSMLGNSRHAFRSVIDEIDDDILPLLSQEQREVWSEYASGVRNRMIEIVTEGESIANTLKGFDKKRIAMFINSNEVSDYIKPIVFAGVNDRDVFSVLKSIFSKSIGSQDKLKNLEKRYNLPTWLPRKGLFLTD